MSKDEFGGEVLEDILDGVEGIAATEGDNEAHGDTLPPSLLPAFRASSELGHFCVEGSCDLLFASIFFATRPMITVRAANEMVISVVLKPENEEAEYKYNATAVDEGSATRPTSCC
ncbi:MAG: hypothetical protein U1F81_10135 [Verrucomicrobiaceae bacterium]